MGKKEFFAKREQNDLGKLLDDGSKEKASGKQMPTRCSTGDHSKHASEKNQHSASEERASGKHMSKRCSTVDDWKHVLEKNLNMPSTLPSVVKGDFQDAKELFKSGKNGQLVAEFALRRKSTFFQRFNRQKEKPIPDEIVLPQFDPNLKSNAVVCRHPRCKKENPDAPKKGTCVKRDLYLCPNHQHELKSSIRQTMAKEGIEFPDSEFASEPGRFEGYTSLISLFDEVFHQSKNETVREVALNTRNFLIITSTLLNPDDKNLSVALPAVADVSGRIVSQEGSTASDANVRRRSASGGEGAAAPSGSSTADRIERTFRETIGDSARVQNLLSLLRGIVDTVLIFFGVIYTWIVPSKIGAKIGAGVGMCIGLIGFAMGPTGGALGVGLGATIGGLLGNGIYDLYRVTRDEEREDRARQELLDAGRQKQEIYRCTFPGKASGPLDELKMYIELSSKWTAEWLL